MTAEIVLQSVVSGLMFGGVIALVAVGISLIWGVMDVINFAYGEYLMWAMYLTFFLYAGAGLDPLVSVPVNALVLFAAGVLTYRLVIERVMRGPIFAQLLSTFGLFVPVGFEWGFAEGLTLGGEYRIGLDTASHSVEVTPAGGTTTKPVDQSATAITISSANAGSLFLSVHWK